jgi:hypothetical protein
MNTCRPEQARENRPAGKNALGRADGADVSESSLNAWPAPFEPFEPCAADVATARDIDPSAADVHEDLRVVEIVPVPRLTVPRPIGPGRRERAYLARVARLESELARSEADRGDATQREEQALRELELASLLERGAERRLDRVEVELARERAELERREQREHRLILALGALENENQRLVQALQRLESKERIALPERASKGSRDSGGWRALVRRVLGR